MEDEEQRKVVLKIQPRSVFNDVPQPPEQIMILELPRQQREYEEYLKLGWHE
jgi:hypothetical protein